MRMEEPGVNLVGSIVIAVLAIAGIVVVAVHRFLTTFTVGGLALEVALPRDHITQPAPSGASVQITQGIITVADADAGLRALTVSTILLAAIAGITVAVCLLAFAVEVSRGRTFSRRSIRLLMAISTIVFIGTTGCYLLDSAIGRGVRTTAGLGEIHGWSPLSYWMGFVIVGALGLMAYAFRYGAQLQKETEGLV